MGIVSALLWAALPVVIAFMINWVAGVATLALVLFLIIMFSLSYEWRTKDIHYTEVVQVKEVYKRGHRYVGSSVGWFEGQPVAHFAYGKWPDGTAVQFRVCYQPGAKMRNNTFWTKVGDEIPEIVPVVKPKPKGHPLVRFLGHLVAGAIALFALLGVIVGISEKNLYMTVFYLVTMIPAILIFRLLAKTRK